MKTWNVYLRSDLCSKEQKKLAENEAIIKDDQDNPCVWIDRLEFGDEADELDLYNSLVDHDNYHPSIIVREAPVELYVFAMDETEYWCDEATELADKIFGLYLYDPKYIVHICSFQGSYELVALGSVANVKQHVKNNNDLLEKLYDTIDEGDRQNDEPGAFTYMDATYSGLKPSVSVGLFERNEADILFCKDNKKNDEEMTPGEQEELRYQLMEEIKERAFSKELCVKLGVEWE